MPFFFSTPQVLGMDDFVLNNTLSPASIDVSWANDGTKVLIRNSTALDAISVASGARYTVVSFDELVNNTTPVEVVGIEMSPDSNWLLIDSDHVKVCPLCVRVTANHAFLRAGVTPFKLTTECSTWLRAGLCNG